MTAGRVLRLTALAPYALAVFLPGLTPTRALALSWLVETGRPGRPGWRPAADFGLRNAAAWVLLHFLRPDAPLWIGAAFLALAVAGRPLWAAERAGRRWSAVLVLVLLLPALVEFCLALGGRAAPAVEALNPWRWAGEAVAAAPAEPLAIEGLAALEYELPPRLWPQPLEDSPERERALVAAAALLVWLAAAACLAPGRRRLLLLGGALAAALIAGVFFQGPKALVVYFRAAAGQEAAQDLRLEAYASGGDLWDPNRGALLPPGRMRAGHFQVRELPEGRGRLRVVSAVPWAVVLPEEEGFEVPAEPVAWLEVHPLRAPRSGGEGAQRGGLGILRLWAGGETAAGGSRWMLDGQGTLYRVPLP